MRTRRPFVPQVVTANRLTGGEVVYRTTRGWTEKLAQAEVAEDEAGLAALEAAAGEDVVARRVIGVYAMAVGTEDGLAAPLSMRERIRAAGGPSVAPVIAGAASVPAEKGDGHVSL